MSTVRNKLRALSALAIAAAATFATAPAARADAPQFTLGNFVIVQIGTPGGTMSLAAQAVNLLEYTDAGAQVGTAHALPATGALALTLSGSGSHDGHLNVSGDRRYLYLGGYRTDAGANAIDPIPTLASAVPRVIGRVGADWSADTSTSLNNAYDNTEIDAVMSDNGSRFWTAGSGSYTPVGQINSTPITNGGLQYVAHLGDTSGVNVSRTQTTGGANAPDSMRSARMVNGQIYITTASSEAYDNLRGAFATTPALPTAGNVAYTALAVNADGNPADSTGKFAPKTDAVYFDFNPNIPGIDTIYGTGGKADYEKWTKDINGNWTRFTQKTLASGQLIVAMDGDIVNGAVHLLATTPQGIYQLTDTAGYGNDFSSTFNLMFSAPSGTEFRGVSFFVPEPATLALLGIGAVALLRRRRRVPLIEASPRA